MRKQILLIDDDLPLCRQIRDALQDDTTEVRYFIDTVEALDSFMRHRYCLVIMDPVLEDMDGQELLRTMRQAKAVPILVLTDALSLEDEVAILSSGATVCAQKPIDLHRCVAQANALIRLYMESEHPEKQYYTLTFGTDLIIDPLHRQVLLKGSLLKLTRKEFNMLHFLASHPGQVFTREQLYTRIWGCDSDFNVDESVRSHIKFLRRKLASSGKEYIQTVWGIGYRFAPQERDTASKIALR